MEKRLALITEDYTLTYKDVKDHLQLKRPPLAGLRKKEIARLIENGRRRLTKRAPSIGE